MKKSLMILICFFFAAPFVCVEAQRPILSESDKKRILRIILVNTDLRDGNHDANGMRIVYFQNDVTPAEYFPKLKGIEFVPITEKEIAEKRKTKDGISYFSFDKFIRRKSFVRISLFWKGYSPDYGSGWEKIYTCRKTNGQWKLKHRLGSSWVAES